MVMLSDQHLHPLGPGLSTWNSAATVSPEYDPLVVIGPLLAVVPLIAAFVRWADGGRTAVRLDGGPDGGTPEVAEEGP